MKKKFDRYQSLQLEALRIPPMIEAAKSHQLMRIVAGTGVDPDWTREVASVIDEFILAIANYEEAHPGYLRNALEAIPDSPSWEQQLADASKDVFDAATRQAGLERAVKALQEERDIYKSQVEVLQSLLVENARHAGAGAGTEGA